MNKKVLWLALLPLSMYIAARCFAETILPDAPYSKGISIITDVKNVNISGYKAFNAGVLKLDEGYLFASRRRADSFLASIWQRYVLNENIKGLLIGELDEDFNEKGAGTFYRNEKKVDGLDVQYLDPRIVSVGSDIYMIYCRQLNRKTRNTSEAYLHIAKLEKIGAKWVISTDKRISFDGAEEFYQKGLVQKRFEKNWMPFSVDGELYFVYLMEPEHVILKTDLKTGSVHICARSVNEFEKDIFPPRGSSPAIFDEELNEWITLYHFACPTTRKITGKKTNAYFFGAYSFSKEAPHSILRRTKGPLIGSDIYNNYHKIIFPTSLIRDGDDYLMFYGDDDMKNSVARISRKELLDSMNKVEDLND